VSQKKNITEAILFAPIREQTEKIRKGELSPVALAEAYLERLEKLGPKLGAVVTVTRELALKEAKQAEAEIKAGKYRGPLHGIPYGVKDLAATRGIPTTWGAEPFRKQVFDHDATIITRLREAGAVLVAKLALVELAGGFGYNNADASFTGPGRTPWNLDFWSGGSSSGPGAAVAAGLVSFAIGSETSGSIITPSAFCGVSGLRPTYGRVSRFGCMALSWTLDKIGPMCRSAECCGLVLAAIAGKDWRDPSTVARKFAWPTEVKGPFKVGILKDCTKNVQPAVKKNFEAALRVIEKFARLEDGVALPDQPFGPVISTIIKAEGSSAFRDLLESGECSKLRDKRDRTGGYEGLTVLAVDYLQAMRIRTRIRKAMDAVYARYDAIVSPSRATVSYPINRDFDQVYKGLGGGQLVIPAGNLAGQPAISLPNGFGLHDLPTGLQFTGRAWSEAKLLALAQRYQQATDWHRKVPPAAKEEG